MQFTALPKPPVGVVFDSDLGNDIDTVLAMALLYGFDGKNEARVVSLSLTRSNLEAAAFCDAAQRFYAAGGFARPLPIGLSADGKIAGNTPFLAETLGKKKPDGTPLYPQTIHELNDTADPAVAIRNALTAQYDQNAMVVLAGPATNLVRAMALPGVKDLIARKVRYLTVSAGSFSGNGVDTRISGDVAASRKLFAEWPTPLVAAGTELGAALNFPGASIENDYAWATAHPVVDAYRTYRAMPYDTKARDMSGVLYAVRPQEGYFKLSAPGTIAVSDDGRTEFKASADGRQRYLVFDEAQKQRVEKVFTEITSAKPFPRQRPRPPKVDVKPEEPKKPDKG